MASTEFTIGMSNGRSSSKVLKPPGGECSDIFGTRATCSVKAKQEISMPDKLNSGSEVQVVHTTPVDMKTFVNDDAKNAAKLNKMKFETVGDAGAKQPKASSIRVQQPPGGKSSGIF